MEDDGFVKVSYRAAKHRKRRKQILETAQHILNISEPFFVGDSDPTAIINNINKHQTQMLASEFFSQFCNLFKRATKMAKFSEKSGHHDKHCLENLSIQDIICYGLGSFSTSLVSCPQMALLLLIRDIIQCSNVFLYDPIFTKLDSEILSQLNCVVIKNNEEGKRKLKKRTIFYLPHCGRPLYNSILWANWTPKNLSKIILIGNSLIKFATDPCKSIISSLQCKYSYLFKVLPAVREHDIPNTFQSETVFNNFTIITFDLAVLQTFRDDVWENNKEPFYDYDDEIILKCKSEK